MFVNFSFIFVTGLNFQFAGEGGAPSVQKEAGCSAGGGGV